MITCIVKGTIFLSDRRLFKQQKYQVIHVNSRRLFLSVNKFSVLLLMHVNAATFFLDLIES